MDFCEIERNIVDSIDKKEERWWFDAGWNFDAGALIFRAGDHNWDLQIPDE